MAIRDWALLGTGLVLAGLGLGAFLFGAADPAETVVVETVDTVVGEPAPLEITGISGPVARVLGRSGGATVVEQADLGLSGPVLRVLQEHRVVLTVPEVDAGPSVGQAAR